MIETPSRKIRISPELMEQLFTRDKDGRRIRVAWGEPDEEGFYEPTLTVEEDEFSRRITEAEEIIGEWATETHNEASVELWHRTQRFALDEPA